MKKIVVLLVGALMLMANAKAFEVGKLSNNKEVFSRVLTNQDKINIDIWIKSHPLGANELKKASLLALTEVFNEFERIDSTCEFGFIQKLQEEGMRMGIITKESEVLTLNTYLRHTDMIDDVLYKIFKDASLVKFALESVSTSSAVSGRPRNLYTSQNKETDIEKLYKDFKTWPDEKNNCSLDFYFKLSQRITWKTTNDRDFQLQKLNYIAYSKKIISTEVFNKLEVLRRKSILNWPIYLNRYVDIIDNAKDRLTKAPELKATNDFGSEYISRKQNITQRGNLYRTYNSTQIMMLAQIIEKTAKRMDSRLVTLNWQYTDDPNGETQVYIFSPMEQYRATLKLLRKDMGEIMRSEAFKGTKLEYSHLIAAAFETGFIKSEELDYILKFEDFWNPKIPKWRTYANFAFSLAGTATFYLPPPWNIIGSIGLILAQGKYVYGDEEANPDDNWNVII